MTDDPQSWTDVFVYGTLLRGEANHFYLASGILVGSDTLPGFWMFDLGPYPMIVDQTIINQTDWPPVTSQVTFQVTSQVKGSEGIITGEHYRIPLAELSRLDDLEDHPHWYRRRWVQLNSGAEAWVYVGRLELVEGSRLIASGNWRQRFQDGRTAL